MIGVKMRVHRLDQFEVKLADELQIAVDPLQHRIDDQRFAAVATGEEISVGSRRAVEQLTKDHGRLRCLSSNALIVWLLRPRNPRA